MKKKSHNEVFFALSISLEHFKLCLRGMNAKILFILMMPMCTTFSALFHRNGGAECIFRHCGTETAICLGDDKCAQAITCNEKCLSEIDVDSCNLLCELNYGYNNEVYSKILACMIEHNCLPKNPMDGICLAEDSDAVPGLKQMDQIKGKWWILKGLNCGQDDTWRGGFDYFPCQQDVFIPPQDTNGKWLDNISFCGGNASVCATDYVHIQALASIATPGVITHNYLDTPLPQNEVWRVISFFDDWMLYIYCGETAAGGYAGGSVVSRTARSIDGIPPSIETEFRTVAAK